MRSVYLMAVDLGTTYIKAAVYDTEGKQISVTRQAVNSDSSRRSALPDRWQVS